MIIPLNSGLFRDVSLIPSEVQKKIVILLYIKACHIFLNVRLSFYLLSPISMFYNNNLGGITITQNSNKHFHFDGHLKSYSVVLKSFFGLDMPSNRLSNITITIPWRNRFLENKGFFSICTVWMLWVEYRSSTKRKLYIFCAFFV